jgi:ankyrin repeat protein
MASSPLTVFASDSKSQTEAQRAGVEMQAQLPGQPIPDSDDAHIGNIGTATGLADTGVQPPVFVAAPGPTPSDAAAEKRMLDAIGGATEQGPRAVVDALWIALPRGDAYEKIYEFKSRFEELPISAACAMDLSLAAICKLLQAFPDHVRKKGEYGWLPLHWAAWNNCNAEVISELLKAYPEAAREKDNGGCLPLHFAAGNNNSDAAVISELLKAYPEAAREKDVFGCLPLHLAAENNSNAAVISELLKAHPDALVMIDDQTNPATLNNILAALSQAGDLPCVLIKNCTHPLRACIKLSAELMAFSRRQRSQDIRLANGADERAAELEQLACAIARNCDDGKRFGRTMDDCLQLAADLKLKFFISEPACSRRIEELWCWRQTFTDFIPALFDLVLRSKFCSQLVQSGPSPPCSFCHEPRIVLCFSCLPPAAASHSCPGRSRQQHQP